MSEIDVLSIKEQVFGVAAPVAQAEPPAQPAAQPVAAVANPAPAANPPAEEYDTVDAIQFLKENFGWEDIELGKKEIEDLRAFKAAPPKPEYQYASDDAKRLAEAINANKFDEVAKYVNSRLLVNDFESKTDTEKLKLFIRAQNPLFDKELVDYEYNQLYNLNEAEFTDEDGNVDAMKQRVSKIKLEQRLMNDVQKAATFFQQQKTQVQLPTIEQPKPDVDEDYEEYKKIVQNESGRQQQLEERLSRIAEKDIVFNTKFNDEASKLSFDLNYVPSKAVFDNAKKSAANWFEFLGTNYRDKDGSPLTEKWLTHLSILNDLEGYTAEVAIQAINAERKRVIATAKNVGDGVQRSFTTVVPDEVQKLKEQIFG
jgi:hypothetical protein